MANGAGAAFKKVFYFILLVLFVGVSVFVLVNYYPIIFSKTVDGQVLNVDRVTQPTLVMGSAAVNAPNVLYSFAIAVRSSTGEIFSGSTEDRQWAIVNKGLCVKARFYPYPPWDFEKGGTYFNVRMLQLKDCPPGTPPAPEQPIEASEPQVPTSAPEPQIPAPSETPAQ